MYRALAGKVICSNHPPETHSGNCSNVLSTIPNTCETGIDGSNSFVFDVFAYLSLEHVWKMV